MQITQSNFLYKSIEFTKNPRATEAKEKEKKVVYYSAKALYEGRERVLNSIQL